ncbi:hypothetical protein ACWD64_10210 [Streptomyces antibioticus]
MVLLHAASPVAVVPPVAARSERGGAGPAPEVRVAVRSVAGLLVGASKGAEPAVVVPPAAAEE